PGGDLKVLNSRLQAIQQFNVEYLEFDVVDASGRLVASSKELSGRPSPDRIATAFNLDGKMYVSAPHMSPVYSREVVYIGVPVMDGGTATGALGTLFDIQSNFQDVVSGTRFNESGYAVIVGGNGRILAHPDESRLNEDVSHYPAV